MEAVDYVLHGACAVMFVVGGIMSKGKRGPAAYVATAAVVIEGMIWTGVLGSLIAMFK